MAAVEVLVNTTLSPMSMVVALAVKSAITGQVAVKYCVFLSVQLGSLLVAIRVISKVPVAGNIKAGLARLE